MNKKGQGHWWETVYGILAVVVLFLVVFLVITYFPQIKKGFANIKDPLIKSAGEAGKLLDKNLFAGLSLSGKEKELKEASTGPECGGVNEINDGLISSYKENLKRARSLSSESLEKQNLISKFSLKLLNCCKIKGDPSCILSMIDGRISENDKNVYSNALISISETNPSKALEVKKALVKMNAEKKYLKIVEEEEKRYDPIKTDLERIKGEYRAADTVEKLTKLLKDKLFTEKLKELKGDPKSLVESYKASIEINKIKEEFKKDCSKLVDNLKTYQNKKYEKIYFIDKRESGLTSNKKPIIAMAIKMESDCFSNNKDRGEALVRQAQLYDKYPNIIDKNKVKKEFDNYCNFNKDIGRDIVQNGEKIVYNTCKDQKVAKGEGIHRCVWINSYEDKYPTINLGGDEGHCWSCLSLIESSKSRSCRSYSFGNIELHGRSAMGYFNIANPNWIDICKRDPCGFAGDSGGCLPSGVFCDKKK
tara:strand:+ start:1996 stop:3426 length:1431 start_codon:yes stop_codon:yes gene_type:complete